MHVNEPTSCAHEPTSRAHEHIVLLLNFVDVIDFDADKDDYLTILM